MHVVIAAASTTPPIPWGPIASVITAVLVGTTLLILIMLRAAKTQERMERDLKFRARKLRGGAILYGASLSYAIVCVIRGTVPAWSLLFAPIPLLFIWSYIRAVRDAKKSQQS